MKISYEYNTVAQRFELSAIEGDKAAYAYLSPSLTQRDTIQQLVNWFNKLNEASS